LGRGRRRDGHINDSVIQGGRGQVALVAGVEEEADVGGAGVGGGGNEVFGLGGDGVAGSDETSEGAEFAADRGKGITDGVAGTGFVKAAGEEVVAVGVEGAVTRGAGGIGEEVVGEDGETEAAEKTELIVGRGEAVVGVLAGEVVEGDGKHGVGEGGKVGTDMAGGGWVGGKGGESLFLEAAVGIAAEGG
jgi:hypothetical protein